MKLSAKVLSILVVGSLLILSAYAQTGEGIITGKVVGRDGMPAQNVQIWIDRMNSLNANQRVIAQRFDTKTNKNGSFSYNGLPPGSYVVSLVENGKALMVKGDTPGDVITVSNGREGVVNFDMTKAPAPVAAVGTAPAPSKADLDKERAEQDKINANKKARDTAFKAGTDAYKAKNFEEAAKQFQIVVEADPKQHVAFANLGNSLNELKKYDEAAAAYNKAIELSPKDAAYYNNLGLSLGGAKKMDEAKAAFETAAMMDPTKAGDYLFNEGAMFNNNQDYARAIEAFKKCAIADPKNKGCILQEAISYFSKPETMAQAEPLLTKFLTLNPSPMDAEMAKAFLEAIHSQAPTEFKSDAAIAAEKAQKEKEEKAAATAAKNPPKTNTPATAPKPR